MLVAFANGLALFAIAAWIVYEAIERLMTTPQVSGGIMVVVAVLGLLVNIAAFVLLQGADRDNLNIRGAAIHVLGDLLGSVAALLAGAVILLTGWTPIDPLLSILVAAIIVRSGWQVVADAGHIFCSRARRASSTRGRSAPTSSPMSRASTSVHHVHVWSITQSRRMVTLHACIGETSPIPTASCKRHQGAAQGALRARPRHRRDRARRMRRRSAPSARREHG